MQVSLVREAWFVNPCVDGNTYDGDSWTKAEETVGWARPSFDITLLSIDEQQFKRALQGLSGQPWYSKLRMGFCMLSLAHSIMTI